MEANYEIHRIAQPPYRDKLPCLWRIMEPRRYWKKYRTTDYYFLEPRRVLYSAYDYESVCPCITSVTDIKNYLTSELQNIDEQSELNAYVRSMRNACNKF